ncbi:hypothetical protein [Paenibacillus senegalensis]|uniref:hypothetical protein n=1 Tax=Paenibacillus senegalensis TaxID=1465766 RepID=UPI000288D366|nr:hypothetical protein [Paenibacillus senegalensis]
MSEHATVCPWCQSEIIWDPDTGPESECPYCYNELGDYRSITLQLEDEEGEEGGLFQQDSESLLEEEKDGYADNVDRLLDRQEETPECSSCHQFMLLSGRQTISEAGYTPLVPAGSSGPFLTPPFSIKLYICPSCFKTESYLSEQDRQALIRTLRQDHQS